MGSVNGKRVADAEKIKAMGRMAGRIAHDFNNILGAIEGYASLLLGTMPTGDPMGM